MTHTSPAAILSWALYSVVFECFLLSHLYQYDRFKCIKWTSGRQAGGAFKRVMTFTYLSTVPLLMLYSIASSAIKYDQGLVDIPLVGIHPKPFQLWPESLQGWITPLYLILSIAWSLEIVTHLEEFAFWMFLLRHGSNATSWFTSTQFKFWLSGSIVSVIGMPLVVVFTKDNPMRCEASILLAGSLGSTTVTVMFLYVLWLFPSFLCTIRDSGLNSSILNHLSRVHRLNVIRIVFRFLFTVPLLLLALDGLVGEHEVNENQFAADFCLMLGGLACIVSSAITLYIFFPLHHDVNPSRHVSVYTETTNNDPFAGPQPPSEAAAPRPLLLQPSKKIIEGNSELPAWDSTNQFDSSSEETGDTFLHIDSSAPQSYRTSRASLVPSHKPSGAYARRAPGPRRSLHPYASFF